MTSKNVFSRYPQFVGQYLEQLLDPRVWVNRADEMLEASKVLEPHLRQYWNVSITKGKEKEYNRGKAYHYTRACNLHDPYFILVSYGLENLFKAIIVRERVDEIRSEFAKQERLPKLIDKHNLVKLSKEANIKMDIEEERVLTRLSRLSKWRGRYPVPAEVGDMQNVIPCSDSKPYFIDWYGPEDLAQISAIVEKIRGHVAGYVNPPS